MTVDSVKDVEQFVQAHRDKPIVAVQGLGFVGAVMSMVVANAGDGRYAVLGVEQNTTGGRSVVSRLNEGEFPVISSDPKVLRYFHRTRKRGNFLATTRAAAFEHADVIIVDINLDVAKTSHDDLSLADFDVDVGPFQAAIETIGAHCRPDALVLVETTVPPGTCRNVVAPTLHSQLRHRGLSTDEIRIGHSYERVMPGPAYVDSIESYYRVYAGVDEVSADATEAFLRTVIRTDEYPLTRVGDTNASEMAKVLENSYRAMNIAFVVEWTRMAEEAGVNLYEVVAAIRQRPTHANLMLPGIGVGGYCLTKDPLLASWARSHLLSGDGRLEHSETAVSINDQMPRYAFEYLERRYGAPLEETRVLLLGASYRGDVADTRYSPVEPFYRLLVDRGAHVEVHDPLVKYWPEVDVRPTEDLREALEARPSVVVISAGHELYRHEDTMSSLLECEPMTFYDTLGLLSDTQLTRLDEKHTVLVLGRGDL